MNYHSEWNYKLRLNFTYISKAYFQFYLYKIVYHQIEKMWTYKTFEDTYVDHLILKYNYHSLVDIFHHLNIFNSPEN